MNKTQFSSVFALVIVGLLASNPVYSETATEVAKVNDKVITLDKLNSHYDEMVRSGMGAMTNKKNALDDLIKREIAVQEAKRLKLEQDPVIVERMNNVLFSALLEKKLGAEFEKLNITDSEAKSWYSRNPEIRTSHIFFALPQGAAKEDEKKAIDKMNQIAKEIKGGKLSFAEAAQRNSEDASAVAGGDLDYRMKDRLDSVFYKEAVKLGKPGNLSNPVRTAYGIHLIRLNAKRGWGDTDRSYVKRLIADEKRQVIVERYLGELRQKSQVNINSSAIKN
jgi:parvulin-like peptidyl-prolyl isomerase